MKIRNGFVSNSSSSSFIVAIREGAFTTENIMKALGLPEGSAAAKLFAPMVKLMTRGEEFTEEWYLDDTGHESIKEAIEDEGWRDPDDPFWNVFGRLREGWKAVRCTAYSDGGDAAELFFYEASEKLNIDTPDILVVGR